MRYIVVAIDGDIKHVYDTETLESVYDDEKFIDVPKLVFIGTRDDLLAKQAEYQERRDGEIHCCDCCAAILAAIDGIGE